MTPRDVEIERIKAAMVRRERYLEPMELEGAENCCPSCCFGKAYTVPREHQERAGAWLQILLWKRLGPGDARFAEAIRCGAWP